MDLGGLGGFWGVYKGLGFGDQGLGLWIEGLGFLGLKVKGFGSWV